MAQSPETESAPPSRFPSLELCYDLAREQIVAQTNRLSTLDTKASFVLGSASILTTAALDLRSALVSSHVLIPLLSILVVLGALAYVVVVLFAFFAYTLRPWKWTPQLSELKHDYIFREREYTMGTMLSNMTEVFNQNERTLLDKARWTKVAVLALLVEAALVALMAAVQIALPLPPTH